MAAYLGSLGPAAFGGENLPKPGTVVMQYTGHSEYNPAGEPPTFAVAGDNDGIANWMTMERRIDALSGIRVYVITFYSPCPAQHAHTLRKG